MPAYAYECVNQHETERVFPVAEKPFEIRCPKCKQPAPQIINYAPALHTLDTFVREIDDPIVKRTHQSGVGYIDPNLGFDTKTGKHTPITSKAQRERLMREAGVYEKPQNDMTREVDRDKRRKAKSFSSTGKRS